MSVDAIMAVVSVAAGGMICVVAWMIAQIGADRHRREQNSGPWVCQVSCRSCGWDQYVEAYRAWDDPSPAGPGHHGLQAEVWATRKHARVTGCDQRPVFFWRKGERRAR